MSFGELVSYRKAEKKVPSVRGLADARRRGETDYSHPTKLAF